MRRRSYECATIERTPVLSISRQYQLGVAVIHRQQISIEAAKVSSDTGYHSAIIHSNEFV